MVIAQGRDITPLPRVSTPLWHYLRAKLVDFEASRSGAMSLLPPSEALEYQSQKDLEDGLQSHAKANGYVITVQQYNKKDQAISVTMGSSIGCRMVEMTQIDFAILEVDESNALSQ